MTLKTKVTFQIGGPAFHPTSQQSQMIANWLGDGIECRFEEGNKAFEPEVLETTDLLVLMGLHWTGMENIRTPIEYNSMPSENRCAFKSYVTSGKPIVLHHGSVGSYDDWAEFSEYIGFRWVWGVSKHTPIQQHTVCMGKHQHPVIQGISDFNIQDEAYFNIEVLPTFTPTVLASTEYQSQQLPMVYVGEGGRIEGAGKVVYLLNGHDMQALSTPAMKTLWCNAVNWALNMQCMKCSASYTAAVVGCGKAQKGTAKKEGGFGIGYWHAAAFENHPDVSLNAAVDISRPNLDAFGDKLAISVNGRFDDLDAMLLSQHRPDLMSICTYVGMHRKMIQAAAEAGVKGIICEKPLVASPADLQAVRDIVKQTGVKIVVAHVRRYCEGFQRARQLIDEGAIGKPVFFFSGIDGWDLSEWGSHWLDMFRFLLHEQPIEWVMGQARVRNHRGYGHAIEDHSVAYFQFEGGAKAMLDGGTGFVSANEPMHMTLTGTTGTLRVYGHSAHRIVLQNPDGQFEERYEKPFTDAWDQLVTDLVDWVNGGPEPETAFAKTSLSAELNLAAYMSMIKGDRVDLPLDDHQLDEWPVEVLARMHSSLGEKNLMSVSASI